MRIRALSLCGLFAGCVGIAACSQVTGPSRFQYTPSINSIPDRGPLSYRVLHSFGSARDGDYADPGLIYDGAAFYGTTYGGGLHGSGTVFSITTSGAERVLHRFGGSKMGGRRPYAALVDVNGTLYGTTAYGGATDDGTVFSISRDGSLKVLHNFGEGTDGDYPLSGLLQVGGILYGTTSSGGTNSCSGSPDGCGTVFSITTSGKEKVLHSFGTGTDGMFPDAALVDVRGTLYSTTYKGGTYGAGVVFGITTGGAEKVLHHFGKGLDGQNPASELIGVSGTLYGTTPYGGTHGGSGTLFSITTSGTERVLHNFGNGTDGSFPYGRLLAAGGTLYGTTGDGGTYRCGSVGCGTLFSMTTGGTETVLHDFGKGTDGSGPVGDLTYRFGRLFGTTYEGGVYANKHVVGGTVFSLTP